MKRILIPVASIALFACATVRQQDIDAWVDMPVEALDTHSLFNSIPMQRRITESGIEIRNYANGKSITSCFDAGSATAKGNKATYVGNTFCNTNDVVCNNIFYIKDGRVIEYAPTGKCFTDDRAQPALRWQKDARK